MSFDLKHLIMASGFAGTSGQNFVDNVLPIGVKHNVDAAAYKCTSWNFSGEPVPEITYNDNTTFNVTLSFGQGGYASYIKRVGNVLVFSNSFGPDYSGTIPQQNSGFQIASSSSSIVGGATGSSFAVTLRAPMAPASGFAGSAWFQNYTSPNYPPYTGNSDPVRFVGSIQPGSGGGQAMLQCFSIAYTPDNGPFNPPMNKTFPIYMYVRPTDTSTIGYDWEWYNDSGYSSLAHSGVGFTVFSSPGDSYQYYLRARKTGAPFWTNVGLVTFVDNRPVS